MCKDEGGNFARAEAVALSVAHPKLFDVKCLECDMRDDVKDPCLEFTFDEATRKALKDEKKIKGKYVPKADFGRYRYQLNLPGSVSGSYSRNLNHLWLVGSIVAMYARPRGSFADESRRRRGRDADIPWRSVAAAPRPRRG